MTVHKAGEARKRATNSTRSTNSTLRLLASTWNSRYGNHYFEKREMENGSLEARSWQRRSTPLLAFQTGMQGMSRTFGDETDHCFQSSIRITAIAENAGNTKSGHSGSLSGRWVWCPGWLGI